MGTEGAKQVKFLGVDEARVELAEFGKAYPKFKCDLELVVAVWDAGFSKFVVLQNHMDSSETGKLKWMAMQQTKLGDVDYAFGESPKAAFDSLDVNEHPDKE